MSFITVNIPPADLRETLNWLNAKPAQVERAERRAVNKTLRWAGAFVARTVASQNAVPLRVLTRGGGKRGAIRVRPRLARGREHDGSVWFGANPVKAAYIGRLSQLRRGARAGRHFFSGAFIAQTNSGHIGVFSRRGGAKNSSGRDSKGRLRKGRLPINEQAVSLQNVAEAARAAQSFIPVRLERTLAQEINFEVNVRSR